MKAVGVLVSLGVVATLGGCGGGGTSPSTGSPSPSTFAVSAAVSGLATGASLTLTDNGSDALTVTTNGTFTFGSKLASGAGYSVTITAQPSAQTCAISGDSGTIDAQTSPVQVSCIGPFRVGGTISGMNSGLQITLSDNGSDTVTVSADGTFSFPTALKPGSAYAIAIGTAPNGEQCSILNASGSVSNADVTTITVSCESPALKLLAGRLGGPGNIDGLGGAARFSFPTDVAVDASGILYVADTYNATVRKIDASGLVTTLAGSPGHSGSSDGVGSAAQFNDPVGLAVDSTNTVYVSDSGADTVRRITPDGTVTTLAGTPYSTGTLDGVAAAARFTNPSGIQVAPSGSLYVVDQNRIRNISLTGDVSTIYTSATQLYAIDIVSPTVVLATNIGLGIGRNAVDSIDLSSGIATPLASSFGNPTGISMAPSGTSAAGTVYVSDEFVGTVSAISSGNAVTVLAGNATQYGSVDGTGTAALLWAPTGLTIDSTGTIFLADSGNNEVRQITSAGVVTTIAGAAAFPGEVDDTGAAARFSYPGALLADASGNLYVGEGGAIRKVTPAGVVTHALSAGLPGPLPTGQAFAIDASGNFYFAINNTIVKITPAGVLTLIAGNANNISGYLDGAAAVALFNHPSDVVFDTAGNLYIADTGNFLIRKMAPDGTVTTVAGQPYVAGQADGAGNAAQFTQPGMMTIDTAGKIYLVDGNAIRTINSAGVVTTLAGSQTPGSADGTGATAQFNGPSALALGSGGSVYVSDTLNHDIRKITGSGVVTTIVGSAGKTGVALGTLPASLNSPSGITYIGTTLYIVDNAENSLLEITNAP
jgi:hypothetical protein